jgi:hypothetical protein
LAESDLQERCFRRVLVEAAAVQLVDEVHVAEAIELNALVRRARNDVLMDELRAVVAGRSQRLEDRRGGIRILELEEPAVR